MGYPLRLAMTKQQFWDEILNHHFPILCAGAESSYAHDYAAIGAFLTRLDDVKRHLKTLEATLRAFAAGNVAALSRSGVTPDQSGNKTIYDTRAVTRKILTRALLDVETQAGFNQAKTGLLHDASAIGTGTGPTIDLLHTGRTTGGRRGAATDASLPAGVPKIVGAIHPTDFMVLLKHGYAFKDVGAESAHGEFTHRLQWYAIIKAKGELSLTHEPIDLYKKMWFSSTKGTANISDRRHLYMWMALLDNVTSDAEATNLATMAWSPGTFNNPEFMNKELTRKVYSERLEAEPDNLFVLKSILRARQAKRAIGGYDGSTKYHEKKVVNTSGRKTVLAGGAAQGPASLAILQNVVLWIETL